MRLLDTSSQTLTEKLPGDLRREGSPYAILSHVWGKAEVVYQDIVDGKEHLKAEESRLKLSEACERALRDGYKYIWIDTCCIDKSSSSELSEAINSMYTWYQDAAECYAFLDDAPDELNTKLSKEAFRNSRWFTRGWTLQELLAPTKLVFFSKNWECLGEKRALSPLLADITGIDEAILKCELPVQSASIAKRMSWAASRRTTRLEDRAYCLMGLFSVNMPMLYGEGEERAFLRLQEEIMKSSDDQSLFAWVDRDPDRDPDAPGGLLAPSPAAFVYSNGMLPYQDWEPREPFMMTNRGLHIRLHLTAVGDGIFAAALDCPVPPAYADSSFLAVYLRKLSSGDGDVDHEQQYARVRFGQFGSVTQRGTLKWIYVRQTPQVQTDQGLYPQHILQLRSGPPTDLYKLEHIASLEDMGGPKPLSLKNSARSWIPEAYPAAFRLRKEASQLTIALIFSRDDGERLAVLVGSINLSQVGFDAVQLLPGREGSIEDFSLKRYEKNAKLSTSGRIETEFHIIRCSASTAVYGSHKYHLINIGIEDVKRSLRMLDIIAADAAEVISRAIGKDISPKSESELEPKAESEMQIKGPGRISIFRKFRNI